MRKLLITFLLAIASSTSIAQSNEELQSQIDNIMDVVAKDISGRLQWKGDLRYRNETIDQEYTLDVRNRDRVRFRLGAVATVNPDVKVEFQVTTTEGGDARSSNQTLTDANSRKALDLDLAYGEWTVNQTTKLMAGKMKYPWVRTSSYFYDGDINPEGVAASYNNTTTGVFGSAFLARLAERGTATDSNMVGMQVGLRKKVNDDVNFTIAASYFDHQNVLNYNVIQSGSAGGYFGNTTKTTGCLSASPCLSNDFDIVEGLVEVNARALDLPLVVFANYAINTKVDVNDKAAAAGLTLNKASLPKSWEVGYVYQKIQKDSLYGQWIDSDFASGSTDMQGHAFRGAYQLNKNLRFNATYMVNETNLFSPASVTIPVAKSVKNRGYDRIQLDLNFTF
jgi:hypothetical protein